MEQHRLVALMIVMTMITGSGRAAGPYMAEHAMAGSASGRSITSIPVGPGGLTSSLHSDATGTIDCCVPESTYHTDRLWLISTRHLGADARSINLQSPNLSVARLDAWGNHQPDALGPFFSQLVPGRPLIIHIHGNRMTEREAIDRGRFIHHNLKISGSNQPMDFVIFSWPSERTGLPVRDGRIKAQRTEAAGLYLAWLLRELVVREIPVVVIGYSFGGRVATGGLHALAGGSLGGRRLPGNSVRGAKIGVGLIAPAIEEDWLESGRYHGLASQNIREMALFYNPRDAILRRYWLIDIATRGRALGFAGPRRLAPGFGGAPVPMLARNCAPFLGIRHSEIEYYTKGCRAGHALAAVVRRSATESAVPLHMR